GRQNDRAIHYRQTIVVPRGLLHRLNCRRNVRVARLFRWNGAGNARGANELADIFSVETRASLLEAQPRQSLETAQPSPEKQPAPQPRPRMVTARAVGIGLLLTPFNAYWVICMEVVRYAGHPTTISLFFNVVFILTVLLGLNALVRRFLPRFAFAPGELLTVYIMLGLSSAVSGHDMIEVLTPILSHATYFARPENGWAGDILPYLPKWLTVSDPQALAGFYTGNGSLYTPHNLRA